MDTVTETLLITETAMDKLVVQNDATVINTIFVDGYFQQSKSLPFALTTVSTATATVVNKNVGTATITGRVTTTISDQLSSSSTSASSTHSANSSNLSHTSSQMSKSTNMLTSTAAARATSSALVTPIAIPGFGSSSKSSNGTILGLAIGLPIALFIIGLACLLGMFYYKRKNGITDLEKEVKTSKRERFLSKIYGAKDPNIGEKNLSDYGKENDEDEYFDSAMNSKVAYRLSKPYISPPTLIKTPQKVAFPTNPYRKTKDINEETYSTSSLIQVQFPKPLGSPFKKWTYESPLSRWFLTKSTLIQDKMQTVKTPTMHLKQLNILARVNKSKITVDDEIPYTEASPMLPTVPTSPYDSIQPLPTGIRYGSTLVPVNETEFSGGGQNIKPQVLETNSKFVYPPVVKLDNKIKSKPLPKPPSFVKSLDPELRRHSNHSAAEKHDLGSARRSTIEEQAKLFQVVKDYQAVLMDEIHIKRGEIVRVLARHTDGWCLVERHDAAKSGSLDGPSYLNEDRGIVPGLCLQECT